MLRRSPRLDFLSGILLTAASCPSTTRRMTYPDAGVPTSDDGRAATWRPAAPVLR